MLIYDRFKKVSLFVKLYFLFLFVILIPVMTINIIHFKYSTKIIEKEIQVHNNALLKNTMNIIDGKIIDIKEAMLLFIGELSDRKYGNLQQPLSNQDIYNLRTTINDLNNFANVKNVDNAFLYFNNIDFFVSTEGQFSFDFFFNNVYKFEDYQEEYWKNLLSELNGIKFLKATKTVKNHRNQVENLITICAPVPYKYNEKPYANFIVTMDSKFINDLQNSVDIDLVDDLIVFDEDNNIISSYNKIPIDSVIQMSMSEKGISDDTDVWQEFKLLNDYIISSVKSSLTGWSYVIIIQKSKVFKKIDQLRFLAALIGFIFILIGFVGALYLSKRMYKPIKGIMHELEFNNRLSPNSEKNHNELEFIQNGINNIKVHNRYLNKFLSDNISILQEGLLFDLLQGKEEIGYDVEERIRELEMNFSYKNFISIVCQIEYFDKFYTSFNEHERKSIQGQILSIIFTLLKKQWMCFRVNIKKEHTIFIVVSENNDLTNSLHSSLENIKNEFSEYMEFLRISFGIGRTYDCYKKLYLSYNEAVEAVNFRVLERKHQIIDYSYATHNKVMIFRYDDQEKIITNNIVYGNIKDAISLIDELFSKNRDNNVPYKFIKMLVYEILGYFQRLARKNGYYDIIKKIDIFDEEKLLISYENIMEYFYDIAYMFNIQADKEIKMNHEALREKILQIISSKYADDLYIGNVAELVGMSPQYLARFFNQNMGTTFAKYLTQYRFSKARELLENTDLKIKDIARMVGYQNVNSFVRAFRMNEGISPGSLRNGTTQE